MVAGATSLVVLGGFGAARAMSDDDRAVADGPCPVITISTTSDLAPVVTQQGNTLTEEGTCADYRVRAEPPQTVIRTLTEDPTSAPAMWIPDSGQWLDLAEAAGQDRIPIHEGPTIASTPVVIGLPNKMASPTTTGTRPWLTVLSLPLASSAPVKTTPSALAFSAVWQQLKNVPAAQGAVSQAYFKIIDANPTQQDLLRNAASGDKAAKAFPTTEQQIAVTNREHPDTPMSATIPQEGLPSLTYTVVRLGDQDEATRKATEELQNRLAGDDGKAALRDAAFRVDGERSAEIPGIAAEVPESPMITTEEFSNILRDWASVSRSMRMLAAVDVSGSMREAVGNTTRIDLAAHAVRNALTVMRPDSEVGLWLFSTNQVGQQDYREVVPISKLGSTSANRSGRNKIIAATQSMKNSLRGDTGLNDTIWGAFQHAQNTYVHGMDNVVVVLTDGANDDSSGGLSQQQLIDRIVKARDPKRPVRLLLIGMGDGADGDALDVIAKAVGGTARLVEDPKQVPEVFATSIWTIQRGPDPSSW